VLVCRPCGTVWCNNGVWGIHLASAGTSEEEVEEDDERRMSAGRRRPARVAATTRLIFDQPVC